MRIGSAWENPDESGFAHFLEHLAFKASQDGASYTRQVNAWGGEINAYTDFDCTCYYISLPSQFLDGALKILSGIALTLDFDAAGLALEKGIVAQEIREACSDPETDWMDFVQEKSFSACPLKRNVLGRWQTLRLVSASRIRAFHAKHYRPDNSFIVVTGDFDQDRVIALLEARFAAWLPAAAPKLQSAGSWLEPEPPASQLYARKKETLFLAYVLPELSTSHPQSDALQLALRYLAMGRSSRLHRELVEERKLCSSVQAISLSGIMSGVTMLQLNPNGNKRLEWIDALFRREWRLLLQGEIDPRELELVKKDVVNTWRYGFECMDQLAEMLGEEEILGGYLRLYDYPQRINALSVAEVRASVQKYWRPERLITFYQGLEPFKPGTGLEVKFKKSASAAAVSLSSPLIPAETERFRLSPVELAPAYYQARLSSNLTILYKFDPARKVTGLALATDVSQLSEAEHQRGVNYLCSTAMLCSTQAFKPDGLLSFSREHGLSLRVEQNTDNTVFWGKCFREELPAALALLSEITLRPAMEQKQVVSLRTAALDQIRREGNNPSSAAFQAWLNMFLGKNSHFGRCTGRASDLRSISRTDLIAWHRGQYHPSRFVLSLVGSLEPAQALDLAARYFETSAAPPVAHEPSPPLIKPATVRHRVARRGSQQAHIYIGGFAPPAGDHAQTTAFYLLAHILGGDMDSRLFNSVREENGYAYQTGFEYVCLNETGYWFAYALCDPRHRQACLRLMRADLAGVCSAGVTADELQAAQNHLCGQFLFEQESAALQAGLTASLAAVGYDPLFYYQRESRVRQASRGQLRQLARQWLLPENQWTLVWQ